MAIFYLLLIVAQGFLATLIAPVPPPDLFLLAVLSLMWRLPPWQLVIVAYGAGLVQDVIGFGNVGMHALGLSGAVLLASVVRSQFNEAGLLERLMVIVSGLIGKWIVFVVLLMWLTPGRELASEVARVMPVEGLLTVLVGMWLLPYAEILMERSKVLRRELL